jgi:DNA polymerase-4
VVTEVIRESVPLYEKASIDEFYLDLTGMDRFFGCMKLVGELKQRIHKEVGLPISFGLSTNKTVSKVATGEAKPAGQLQVLRGQEKGFLAPLSVRKIPGVGAETYRTLRGLGIEQIHSIQEMPKELMEKTLGKNGLEIWKKSNGIDPTPVIAWHERKSLSMERTFDQDTIDIVKLKGILTAMTESLAYQLRKGQRLTQCVSVKLRYSDFHTHTLQQRIAYTSADHILIPQILDLFERLYQRRILIRLIGVRFSELVGGGHQMDLFEDRAEMMQLYEAMDRIRNRYGDRSVMRAAGMLAKSIGRNDNPFDGSAPLLLANRRS